MDIIIDVSKTSQVLQRDVGIQLDLMYMILQQKPQGNKIECTFTLALQEALPL